MNIGKQIRILRKTAGLTQVELADILHRHRGALSNYELGIRAPDIYILSDIADYFGVTLDWIAERE